MPKIRDLGINVIPSTMRPPEIGPGGYRLSPEGDDAGTCTLNTCIDGSAHHCDSPSPAYEECRPTPHDDGPHCEEKKSHCPDHTKQHTSGAGGLTPGAVEQLRQQMRTELHP